MKSEENSTSPSFRLTALLEVYDALVVRIGDGEGEINASSDALVGPAVPNCLPLRTSVREVTSTRTTRA